MKNKFVVNSGLLLSWLYLIFFQVGCQSNHDKIKKISIGMTKKQVVAVMGAPTGVVLFPPTEAETADSADSMYLYKQSPLASEMMRIHINVKTGKVTRVIADP